jgi:hypothetical protein
MVMSVNPSPELAGIFCCIFGTIFVSYIQHYYLYPMKKGEKLLEKAHLVQIKDIHNKTVGGGLCRSLRQAVSLASEYVTDMANYPKVYREYTLMKGAYAGVFFSKSKASSSDLAIMGRKPSKHLFVLINSAVLPSAEIEADIHHGPQEGFLGEIGELMGE